MWTVQVTLSTFLNSQSPRMTQLFAASAIAILPLLVGFVLLQRYIVEGVERTGISG
jgi:multiple sugar transport system permease protein